MKSIGSKAEIADRNSRYPELEIREVAGGEKGSSVQNPAGYVISSEERK